MIKKRGKHGDHLRRVGQSGRLTYSRAFLLLYRNIFKCLGPGLFVNIEGRFVKEKYLNILRDRLNPWIDEVYEPNDSVNHVEDNSSIDTARIIRA